MVKPGTPMTKLPTMTVATPGVVSNVGKQVGVQNVATTGTFNNVGSQIGQQIGRKKRAAQFNNWGSQIGQQISGSAQFNNCVGRTTKTEPCYIQDCPVVVDC